MGLRYDNLDNKTRASAVGEVETGPMYESPRLTEEGLQRWPGLLREALANHDDDWLADQVSSQGLLKSHEDRKRDGKTFTAKVPTNAAQQLAEGEFNRFYIRGLALRAMEEGVSELEIYRGRESRNPRPESEAKIGTTVPVELALSSLRTHDFVSIETVVGVPGGPNSGLTCRLARSVGASA